MAASPEGRRVSRGGGGRHSRTLAVMTRPSASPYRTDTWQRPSQSRRPDTGMAWQSSPGREDAPRGTRHPPVSTPSRRRGVRPPVLLPRPLPLHVQPLCAEGAPLASLSLLSELEKARERERERGRERGGRIKRLQGQKLTEIGETHPPWRSEPWKAREKRGIRYEKHFKSR